MPNQTSVYEFEVKLCGLEEKFWRNIELTSISTLAKLAYAIMASFELSGSHLFCIMYNELRFEFSNGEYDDIYEPCNSKLNTLDLKVGDKLKLIYDFGAEMTFDITLTEIKEFKKGTGTHYPYVLSGVGESIPENYFIDDLIEKINHNDIDYKEYNSKIDNALLKGKMLILKNIYEDDGESNIILN